MDSLQNPPFFEVISQVGPLTFLLNSLIGLAVFIAITHHKKLAEALLHMLWQFVVFISMQAKFAQTRVIEKIDNRVSATYTEMNMLDMEPFRTMIVKFQHKKGKWYITIRHESCRSLPSIKARINGIESAEQITEHLIEKTREGIRHYVENVDEMPSGDLKSLFLYYNIRSFYSILLDESPRTVVTMLVTFNRDEALEEGDFAALQLCAANVKKAMFAPI